MEESISGWSVAIMSTESDYEMAQALVYYKGNEIGEYDNGGAYGEFFDDREEFGKSPSSLLDLRFYDFSINNAIVNQYVKANKDWNKHLESQFKEELSNQETLAYTLFKLEEMIAPDKSFLAISMYDFVLAYSRIVKTDEFGKELVNYTLSGYDIVDDSDYTKDYIKEMKSDGYFPIRLTYNMR